MAVGSNLVVNIFFLISPKNQSEFYKLIFLPSQLMIFEKYNGILFFTALSWPIFGSLWPIFLRL